MPNQLQDRSAAQADGNVGEPETPTSGTPASTEVVATSSKPEAGLPVLRGTDVSNDLAVRLEVADKLSRSGMIPKHYVGQAGNVLAAQFAADALDIPLFTAFQHLHHVDGKVGQSAELMRALLLRAGYTYQLTTERDAGGIPVAATMTIYNEAGKPYPTERYTLQDAVNADLVRIKDGRPYCRSQAGKKKPWETDTAGMLRARVTSTAARAHTPHILAGFGYVPDELDQIASSTVTVEQVHHQEPAPPSTNTMSAGEQAARAEVQRPGHIPWTADTAARALCAIDPADDGARDKLTRLWFETGLESCRDSVVAGMPFADHWKAAKDAILSRGEPYALDGVTADPELWLTVEPETGEIVDDVVPSATLPDDTTVSDAEIVTDDNAVKQEDGQAVA